jgi:hypothetical protein
MVVEILWRWSRVFRLEFLCSLVLVYFEFSLLCVDLFMSSFYIYYPVVLCVNFEKTAQIKELLVLSRRSLHSVWLFQFNNHEHSC